MEIIRRKTDYVEKERINLNLVSFNSKGTLTFLFKDINGTEILINFNKEEIKTIKDFIFTLE